MTQEILQELNACAAACNVCYNACLNEEDVDMMTRCIELDRECADICQLTASILARDSENADKYLKFCADICDICAGECKKQDKDHCRECARACSSCAALCRSYQPPQAA
jgi:hypothetical protein